MNSDRFGTPVEILLVEDNPGDVRLTLEALKEGKIRNNLTVARDGEEALTLLRQEDGYSETPQPTRAIAHQTFPPILSHSTQSRALIGAIREIAAA